MTDLDTTTLRLALKAPGDPSAPVDVTQIMTRGRRLRRRRRSAAVAGGICAVAILAGAGTAVASLTAEPSVPSLPAGPAQHRPTEGRPPTPVPSPRHTSRPGVSPAAGLPAAPVPSPSRTVTSASVASTPSGSPASPTSPTPTAVPTSPA